MVDFSDRNDTREWFRNQSRDVTIAITLRSVLRALPKIVNHDSYFSYFTILAVFRSTAVPWAMLTDLAPDFEPKLRLAANAAAAYAETNRGDPVATAGAGTAYAAAANAGATRAATAADALAYAYDPDTAAAASADAAFIQDKMGGATELAATPLWPGDVPKWATSMWAQVRSRLVEAKQNWGVWIDWYEDRLAGRRSDARIDLAKALFPDDLWKQGPQAVNIEIKRLIDELREQGALPDQNSMPKQAPSATIFQRHESGAIALFRPVLKIDSRIRMKSAISIPK